ncbi:hypothetical protein F5B20DRAFT_540321 [Whalleya microplaca]|nr:hypothetical protein F5B20DRAFT_540321 [Whalleya microplaca]
MGLILKGLGTVLAGTATGATVGVAYLTAATNVTTPLSEDDEIWRTTNYTRLNQFQNPSVQDRCWKRLPLSKVRPELRNDEEAIATEFFRGLWAGYAFAPQRSIATLVAKGPKTNTQLFSKEELGASTYEPGTQFSDHFEVLERTRNAVMFRAGGSPLEPGPRVVDGILIASAEIDKEADTVEVSLKSLFFNSAQPVDKGKKAMPGPIEWLHQVYARAMVDDGARHLK